MNNYQPNIKRAIEDSIKVKTLIFKDENFISKIDKAVDLCLESLNSGGKIWFAGNGGSAADAQHLAAELSGRFYFDRLPLAAEALHVNSSFLTAASNDYGFEHSYARALMSSARDEDLLVALSTSGNSKNIVVAAETAQAAGLKVIALTGETGGALRDCCDLLLNVPSDDTARIQECHIMIGHIICENIEKKIFE